MKANSPLERLYNGIIKENPTFVLMLGMCPTLAVTTSAKNGFGMGMTTMVILALSNLMISMLRKMIPDSVRYIYRKYRYLLFGDHAQNYGCGDFKLCDGGTSGARNGGYPVWNRLYSADAGNVPGRLCRHPAWRAGLSSVFQSGSHTLWTDRTADNQRLRTGTAVWPFWRLQPFLWGGTYGRTVDSGTTGLFRSSPDRCRTAYSPDAEMKKPCEFVVIAYILACMSREFGIFMPKHFAVQ